MSEIPEDIYVAARKAYDEGFDKYGGNRLEAIAEAIWNERQRAAKIADEYENAHHTAIRDAILNP